MSATSTRERPIIFSAQMVRAILDGRKTQTRRVVKPQPIPQRHITELHGFAGRLAFCVATDHVVKWPDCPYGAPGDTLWVRETWNEVVNAKFRSRSPGHEFGSALWDGSFRPVYQATDPYVCRNWRPSIHMPRHLSRISLRVTAVRGERLQEINEESAVAEGVAAPRCPKCAYTLADCRFHMDHRVCGEPEPQSALPVFEALWSSINGKRAPWASNPWVWVVEFAGGAS